MKIGQFSNQFKVKEVEAIEKNYQAFVANFGYEPILHKNSHGVIDVYKTEADYEDGSYVQRCFNLDYLNGWLYGAVQAFHKRLDIRE